MSQRSVEAMLRIAKEYEQLAKRAEERAKRLPRSKVRHHPHGAFLLTAIKALCAISYII
jgi:hypothetical protein